MRNLYSFLLPVFHNFVYICIPTLVHLKISSCVTLPSDIDKMTILAEYENDKCLPTNKIFVAPKTELLLKYRNHQQMPLVNIMNTRCATIANKNY